MRLEAARPKSIERPLGRQLIGKLGCHVVLGAKQVIEIQFINSSLIGLTLLLEKG